MGKRRFSEIFAVARTKGIVASMAQVCFILIHYPDLHVLVLLQSEI